MMRNTEADVSVLGTMTPVPANVELNSNDKG